MKFYEIKKLFAIIILILFHFIIISCSSPKHCIKSETDYNLQTSVNSNWDELSPFFLNDTFFFSQQNPGKKKIENIYKYNNDNNTISASELFKLKNYNSASNFSFYLEGDSVEVFFTASIVKNKIPNRDIFTGKIIDGKIIDITPVYEINSDNFEAYPVISKDGRLLVFVSDRAGGIGGTDLYLSLKDENGVWSKPINFGDKVNTPANEISPFLDELDNLYYSSNGFDNRTDFNIMKSNYLGDYQWALSKSLPVPINSDSNDITPFIRNNQIYYASNRIGGCGGFDIYFTELCGDVLLTGEVFDSQGKLPLNGVMNIYDDLGKLISEIQINDDGAYRIELNPNSRYIIEYYNTCVPLYTPRKTIQTQCNEEEITLLNLPIELKLDGNEYEFSDVDIPFFMSGYYKPNTPDELQNLRTLFDNNIVGLADSTKYIEYPDEKYDDYSVIVQNSLHSLSQTIIEILNKSKTNCDVDLFSKIKISITGYADERGFSDFAKYSGGDIIDPLLGVIPRGMKMDNNLLGLLRAYYTYKYLENILISNPHYQANQSKIKWDISSGGVSTQENELILKRKVKIYISTEF